MSPDEKEIARVIDPASKKEKVLNEIFAASPDGFAIVSGNRVVAQLQSEELTSENRNQTRNRLGRLLDKIAFLNKGLTLRVDPEFSSAIDIRVLLAAMILLEVHDISGVLRNA